MGFEPTISAFGDSSCLRPRGHRDRQEMGPPEEISVEMRQNVSNSLLSGSEMRTLEG
jgi:hypothetical protein